MTVNEKHELKSTSNRAIKSTEIHQQAHSAQYSAEVIEWQKVAKREKVESSVYRDSKTQSVSGALKKSSQSTYPNNLFLIG